MFILFGWGHQKAKGYGPVFKNRCNNCNNEDYWMLHGISTWFTLFFIPVFPYENKYFLSCPVCSFGVKLDSAKFNELKPFAELNMSLVEGKITSEQYNLQLNSISVTNVIEAPQEAKKLTPKKVVGSLHCVNCGTKIITGANFCRNCGKQIPEKVLV